MTEIYPNLFVGTTDDYEAIKSNESFFTVIAAKEPYHRRAVGYSGRACSKNNPEYLYAERERCLICNLVDVENPDWVSSIIINKAFEVIDKALFKDNKRVLICCNQGRSCSASIGLMYMKHRNAFESDIDFNAAEECFKKIYPAYEPAGGMRGYTMLHWNEF